MSTRRLPLPPPEVPRETSLDGLMPEFQSKVVQLFALLRADGFNPIVGETLRTNARQEFLYGFGRTWDDGRRIVTHSRTGERTWHFYGCAIDIWDGDNPRAPYNIPRAMAEAISRHCLTLGLTHGADWNRNGDLTDESFADWPHVQVGPPARRSPSDAAARLKRAGGNEAVWRALR